MTKEDIKQAAKEGVTEAIGDLFVEPKKHYDDHQFVGGVRGGIRKVRTGSLITLGASTIGAVGWVIKSWVASLLERG